MTTNQEHPWQPLIAYSTSAYPPAIVPAPARRDWMDATGDSFANRCLPMLVANQGGWLILNNFSLTVTWSGGNGTDALDIHYGRGASPPLAGSHFGYGILTWSIPLLFRTPPGFDLLVRGPANMPKDGVCALEGVVESDWASASFTMNWKLTRAAIPVTFAINEPIAMISAQPRGLQETFLPRMEPIERNPETAQQQKAWGASRRAFIRDLRAGKQGRAGWQRHYFQGRHATGEAGEFGDQAHTTRLHLREFDRSGQ